MSAPDDRTRELRRALEDEPEHPEAVRLLEGSPGGRAAVMTGAAKPSAKTDSERASPRLKRVPLKRPLPDDEYPQLIRRFIPKEMSDEDLVALIDEARHNIQKGRILWLICPLDGRSDPQLIARDLARFPPAIFDEQAHVIGPCIGAGRVSLVIGRRLPRAPHHPRSVPRRNGLIRAPLIHLFGPNEQELGLMSDEEARATAGLFGLDLVELARRCPSICQLLNYGLWRYESKRRERMKARPSRPKEVRVRISYQGLDLERKIWSARCFLRRGFPVRFRFMFRDFERRRSHDDSGKMNAVIEGLLETGAALVEQRNRGCSLDFTLAPVPAVRPPRPKEGV